MKDKIPSCDYCELIVFPDGEEFHELTCPTNTSKTDNRDLPKLKAMEVESAS